MSSIPVSVKHAGAKHDLELDTSLPPLVFKQQIHQVTGVDPEKQKVLVKGGTLKDDTDWSKLGIKSGHVFMVVGTAGPLPKAPEKPVMFMEDMTVAELASVTTFPAGLDNLGNTCYMNSTLQVLLSIPHLRDQLSRVPQTTPSLQNPTPQSLTASLSLLLRSLTSSAGDSYSPWNFWTSLRGFAPQFAEQRNGAWMQQDAEECWTAIVGAIRNGMETQGGQGWVEKWMMGTMETTTRCIESTEEPPVIHKDNFAELKCNISISTNYLFSGITDALTQPVEKRSDILGREAQWEQKSAVSRLPTYLAIHQVRFFWRRDIQKKTKILRKVKFPFNLDLLPICSDDLKSKMSKVAERMREVEKERAERAKIARRRRVAKEEATATAATTAPVAPPAEGAAAPMEEDEPDEEKIREKERVELEALVDPSLKADEGACVHGQYELWGVVTHKGASADGGHYLGWVRRTPEPGSKLPEDPDQQEWYKFDDDKVAIVPRIKVSALDGGGEDSTAYLLLYRAVEI